MKLEDILDRSSYEVFKNQEHQNLAWVMTEVGTALEQRIDELEEKVDTTWNRLQQDPNFRSRNERTQKIMWELAKILENDSPKNQKEVAEQYDVNSSRISKLKKEVENILGKQS